MKTKSSYQEVGLVGDSALEFFQLDEIDRNVFFWLIDHEKLRLRLKNWLEFISNDYRERYNILLDIESLHQESLEALEYTRKNG